jgi:hypothetical protein
MMERIHWRIQAAFFCAALSFASSASAELLLYEPFDIGPSPAAGQYTLGVLDPSDAIGDGQNPASSPTASYWTGGWQRDSAVTGGGTVQEGAGGLAGTPIGVPEPSGLLLPLVGAACALATRLR